MDDRQRADGRVGLAVQQRRRDPDTWSEGRERLEGAEVYWISTVRPDGRPHVTPLLSVWLDGALYFCTGPDERKAKNLVRNPHCILTTGCNALDDPAGGFGFGRHLSTLAVRGEVRTQVTRDLAILVLARIDRAATVALLLLPSHCHFSSPMARAALPACFPTSQPDFPCQSPSNARSLRATPPMLPLASRARVRCAAKALSRNPRVREGQRKACGSQPELSRRRESRTCKSRI